MKCEIEKAFNSINRGKSEDIFGLHVSIENIIFAGEKFLDLLHRNINFIFENQLIPEFIKIGLLSPIFKNKGDKHQAKNYRSIVVLLIFIKLIEFIARIDLRPILLSKQSPIQRGFTEGTSPINAAVIFEEVYREFEDQNNPFYIALLDAKSAFDVVVLKILMRKAYLLGIDLSTWLIIDELHRNTRSVVKSNNQISQEFYSSQGVKQGALLSADLYKLYLEDMLNTLSLYKIGCTIGSINVNAVACADDVALISDTPYDLQILLNTAVLYSQKHHYTLQPQKSVIIPVNEKLSKSNKPTHTFRINGEEMPNVEKSSHLEFDPRAD